MDKRYELYCVADPLFYDLPEKSQWGSGNFSVNARTFPEGWEKLAKGEWTVCVPPAGMVERAQGWKIHVSACLDNAEKVLAPVWEYCANRQISFKYLRAESSLLMRNAKYASRGSSGKFITIYPADDAEFERILGDLDPLLAGQPGPYILSDLRFGEGPLYVRYGAFTERLCEDDNGELVHAIEDASGRLVPDRRAPVFSVPDWVELPEFLAPHLAASKAVTMTDLPYRIEQALHFSNGGGVYTGTDLRTREKVVLKEARPFAGLAADGSDAVERLRRERDILRQLDGVSAVPGVRDYFECGGHHFLVQEFIEGRPLNTCYVERYPLLQPDPDPAAVADYTAWALRMSDAVADLVRRLHERGVVFNDLHMFNVMVRPDDSIALLDFEVAARIDEDRRRALGNPGFAAPRDRKGFDSDLYSLACLRLAMFLPLTTLFQLDRAKAGHFAEVIAQNFPVPSGYLDDAVREITRGPVGRAPRNTPAGTPAGAAGTSAAIQGSSADAQGTPGETPGEPQGTPGKTQAARPRFEASLAGLAEAEASLARAICASATPERDDRLFPGDIRQFDGEALGLAHGAAGILCALSTATGDRFPEFEDWLISHARTPPRGTKLGLYDGLIGAACALAHFGHASEAVTVAEQVVSERWERLGPGLYGGLAGLGLGLLYLGDTAGEPALRDAGLRAVELTASRLEPPGAGETSKPGTTRVGLMHGASGPALLLIRMFERTGDSGYLDLAAVALGRELDACVTDSKGALAVNEGWRTMPYLGDGSAGIGLVAQDYLRHADDERFAGAVPRIRRGARSVFYVQPGLLAGRAGMLLSLTRGRPPGEIAADPDVAAQIRRLEWHAVSYADGAAFPGDNLLRLSMDLATGTAGVLLALNRVRRPDGPDLPFTGAL